MKRKNIKKAFKSAIQECEKERYSQSEMKAVDSIEEYERAECNPEIQKKFLTLVTNLVSVKHVLGININKDSISISGNLDNFKSKPSYGSGYTNSSKSLKSSSSEDYVEIRIDRKGFKISRDYRINLSFKDETLFDNILPIIVEKNKTISNELLDNTIDDIMVITKLSRSNNLDELLSE